MKIRAKITASLFAVSLSAIVLVSIVSFHFARNALLETNGKHLLALASGEKNYVSYVLQAWQDEISLITSRTQLRMFFSEHLESPAPRHIARMEEILLDATEASHAVKKIGMCDLQGRLVVMAGDPDLVHPTCGNFATESVTETVVADVWMSDAGELYALVAGPVLMDDEIIGIASAFMSASELLGITQNYTGLGETSEILIAERTAEGHARFLTPLRYDPNPGLTRIVRSDQVNVPITYAMLGKGVGLIGPEVIDYRGQSVLAATAYIPEMDWGLVVKIDRDEALKPIQSLLLLIGISALVIFLLITVIGFYVGRGITGPISRFISILRDVRDGDLSRKIHIQSGDEVGYLASSFNEMLESLREKTAQLTDSEMQQRAVVDSIVDGLITIDEHGFIQSLNNACETIFGYTPEETLGQNVKMLMPEPYHSEHDGYLKRYHDTGERKIIGIGREVKGKHKSGRIFPLDLSVSEVSVKDRKLYSGIVRDISQRKAAEEEIKQANAELEEFAYRTSHDLRSPLVSSIGLLSIAEKAIHADDKDRALASLTHTQSSLRKLEGLVKDILMLTRIKNVDEDEETIDVEAVINETLDKFRHMADFERLDIQQELNFSKALFAKKSRIILIMENLISNSIKYQDLNKSNSFINISTYREGDKFVFRLQDNGLGVPKDQQDSLFQMFKRFHPKISFGSGLGLYMMKKSADVLGARVVFEDPGDGAIFKFEMPIEL